MRQDKKLRNSIKRLLEKINDHVSSTEREYNGRYSPPEHSLPMWHDEDLGKMIDFVEKWYNNQSSRDTDTPKTNQQ